MHSITIDKQQEINVKLYALAFKVEKYIVRFSFLY
jgi:hypothetical protein